jgi:hypothetical protein
MALSTLLASNEMDSFKDTVTFWASILGTFLGLLGAFQSITWLTALGGVMIVGSICAIAYATRQRQRVESAVLKVAGRSIDSLNMASLRRRVDRSLMIQAAHNTATVDGENLAITWECAGYCRADRETSIEFSIDSDNNVPFDELDCFAHDLEHDPHRRHRIRPILIGPDGISKKVAVPFLQPLKSGEPFNVSLTCKLPGCMKAGVDYYTASVSFDQDDVLLYSVRLIFLRERPSWLRVYEAGSPGTVRLLMDLRPTRMNANRIEYLDTQRNFQPKSVRIYVFTRSVPFHDHNEHLAGTAIGSV